MSTPTLALVPSGYKASKVYSVLPTDGTGDFDFSRASAATRVNSEGLIELVSSNVPRLNYPLIDGVVQGCPSLLLEPARTNLVTYSELFHTYLSVRVDTTITDNYGVSPDGSLNSSRIQFIDDTSYCYAYLTISTSHTASCYVKGVQGEIVRFGIGSTIATGSLFTFNGEWQRIEYTTSSAAQIFFSNYSGANTGDFEVFGLQLEAGSYATSYIPTQGSTVTRVQDFCTSNNSIFNIGTSDFTIFSELSIPEIVSSGRVFYKRSGGSLGWGFVTNASGYISLIFDDDVVPLVNGVAFGTTDVSSLGVFKFAVSFDRTANASCYINGVLEGVIDISSFGTVNNAINFAIAVDAGGSLHSYIDLKQLSTYSTALSNAEMIALTSL